MRVFAASILLAITPSLASADSAKPWAEKTHELGQLKALPSGKLSSEEFEKLRVIGEALFAAPFTTLDGAGRPMATQAIIPTKPRRPLTKAFARTSGPDAHACGSCHNEPLLGGAGDFATNVFVSEGFNNHDFDTTDPEFSNERGSNHLFGSGLIELLAREMTADLQDIRAQALLSARSTKTKVRVELTTKGVSFGAITIDPSGLADLSEIEGVDSDLVVRPFSQKGVFVSLRQFTVNALNHHHGMQPNERWGARWTGEDDFFEEMGCVECHRTTLPLDSLVFVEPNPYDGAGTLRSGEIASAAEYDLSMLDWAKSLPRNDQGQVLVPLFGDLKRHKMTDAEVSSLGNELFSQRFVGRDIFMTSELWGVGSTAPYGHRNDFTTLDEIIRAHGGDARSSRDSYVSASVEQQDQIIAFLKTLRIEASK